MNARTGRASIDSGIALPFRSKPTKWRMFLDMPQELRFVVYEILLDLNAKAYMLIEPLLGKMTPITNLLWSSRQIRADIHALLSRAKVRIMAGVLQDWTLRPYSLLRDHDMDQSGAMAHQAWSEFNKTVPFEFKFTRVLLGGGRNDWASFSSLATDWVHAKAWAFAKTRAYSQVHTDAPETIH
ncbi:MAG: Ubiquitin [Aureobasidium pullulans]|nr:MAG: Ubiquitin [Aureobasidium pullulans]